MPDSVVAVLGLSANRFRAMATRGYFVAQSLAIRIFARCLLLFLLRFLVEKLQLHDFHGSNGARQCQVVFCTVSVNERMQFSGEAGDLFVLGHSSVKGLSKNRYEGGSLSVPPIAHSRKPLFVMFFP